MFAKRVSQYNSLMTMWLNVFCYLECFGEFHTTCFHRLRFRTNPDDPGTEKLSIVAPTEEWLEQKYVPLPFLADPAEGPTMWGEIWCQFQSILWGEWEYAVHSSKLGVWQLSEIVGLTSCEAPTQFDPSPWGMSKDGEGPWHASFALKASDAWEWRLPT